MPTDGADRQRVDKWLWHARIVRTRNAAAALAESGLVRLNGSRIAAASRPVRSGDVLTIALDGGVKLVKVVSFAERRGSAAAARALYQDLQVDRPPAEAAPTRR